MRHENPTPLQVGAQGAFEGWRVKVAGRVVLGVEIDGETYYWNEFNLVGESGSSGTLVYEDGEQGPEWKLFRLFQPLRAMSAREAAAKRVGDTVNLDGSPTRITLVDQSQVYHIEGTAPAGTKVGDVDGYFNADTGSRMLVATWSGDDIEFYEGHDVPPELVAQAFGLPATGRTLARASQGTAAPANSQRWINLVVLLLVFPIATAIALTMCQASPRTSRSRTATSPAVRKVSPAPTLRIETGAKGTLAGRNYTVAGRAIVDVARVGQRHGQNEYQLVSEGGETALLVNALAANAHEWHLLLPLSDLPGLGQLSPHDAATRRKNDVLPLPGRAFRVTDLLQARTVSRESVATPSAWPSLQYGFVAREADEWLLARWTEQGIQFHHGRTMPELEVLSALGVPPPETK